jgi:hypothetical protein
MTINAINSKHAGKMIKFKYMYMFKIGSVIFQKVTFTSSMCPWFEECQFKSVGEDDYTK